MNGWHQYVAQQGPAHPAPPPTLIPGPGTRTGPGIPPAGTVLLIGRAASVQFGDSIMFRLVRALDLVTYDGWIWLEGYELDSKGDAVDKRQIYVQIRGLRVLRNRR